MSSEFDVWKRKDEAPTSPSRELAELCGHDETVLLVEYHSAVRITIRKTLLLLGYAVLEAANGAEALEIWGAQTHDIRLLLTDLVLPDGMAGWELAERLLRDDPKLKVIYMSGYGEEMIGKYISLEEGINFLTKPFPTTKLARTVRARLESGPID
jgi:two-component system, cell cycle sensor histidine kinase and response regulator CckA